LLAYLKELSHLERREARDVGLLRDSSRHAVTAYLAATLPQLSTVVSTDLVQSPDLSLYSL